ncbi:MAG: hypothetical protein BMS9Abin23_1084 [Thermodesulfobacteriota bacterium]|nr:MAG: hypothetical protein BMS9Abin23_1084 [Thermodesulfobacteriota bacterium]
MKDEQILEKLEEAAERLSVELGYEDLRKGEVNTPGGIFLLNGEKRILIHKGLSTRDKVDVICEAFSSLDTEAIHLPEAVRKRIEKSKGG